MLILQPLNGTYYLSSHAWQRITITKIANESHNLLLTQIERKPLRGKLAHGGHYLAL